MAIIFDGTQGITTPAETANNSVTTPIVKSSANLVFQTNGTTEAMRIDSSGNLNIGAPSNVFGSKLGITSSAAFPLAVITPSIAGTSLNKSTNGAGNHILMTSNNSFNYGVIGVASANGISTGDVFTLVYTPSGGAAATNVLNWSSAGYVTTPLQPAFRATKTNGQGSSGPSTTIVFNQVNTNIGSCYNNSTGFFTAPVAGMYQLNFTGITNNASTDMTIEVNGTAVCWTYCFFTQTYANISMSVATYMNAGDYARVFVKTGNLYDGSDGGAARFSGFLIG